MSGSRPYLTPSLSFAGSSSVSAFSRPLKRRLTETPDLDFFTPAAQSFKPRPYTPNGTSAPVKPPPATRSHSSSNIVQPTQMMDPSSADPLTVFLHPPFTTFPNSHLHPEGISYALMAANPEWFLDAADFISTTPKTDGQDVISYPPQLEPPRGWCPAKKKDLKALGAEGWPEGEEPRLRCTFCRRTYAGVNAKSMWRRHVYEKHKIAMANRREGSDRVRGRISNKENRHAHSRNDSDDGGRRTMKLEPTSPQENYDPLSYASSSRFRSLAPPIGDDFGVLSAPYIEQNEFPMPTISVNFSEAQLAISSISPPLTPQSLSPEVATRSFSEPASPSPKCQKAVIPASPYNPLLTPSFRHSPPRLPSDQPWRFPSPSHPLHSKARELYLGAVVRGATSPSVSILDSSPVSMLNTPAIHHKAKYNAVDSDNTDRLDSSPIATRASPSLYGPSQSPFPSSRAHIDESPLNRLMRRKNNNRQKSALSVFSEVGNDWFSDGALPSSSGLAGDDSASGMLTPIRVVGDDPFARLYSSWVKEPQSAKGNEGRIAPLTNPCEESPVLRSSQLREGRLGTNEPVGLGIGLMAPFNFASEEFQSHEDFSDNEKGDLDLNCPPSPEDERDMAEVHSTLTSSGPPGLKNFGLRRTHMFMSGFEIQDENDPYEPLAPPLKRRRTVPMHD